MGRERMNCPYCGETAHATVPNNAAFYSARKDSKQGGRAEHGDLSEL